MPIVGFNFDKVSVEKQNPVKGKVTISHNVQAVDIVEENLNLGSSGDTIRFKFKFSVDYSPDIANITLLGSVLYMAPQEEIKNILKNYKETKEMPKELMPRVFDTILARCNVKSLVLAEEVNLPAPLKLPRVKEKPK